MSDLTADDVLKRITEAHTFDSRLWSTEDVALFLGLNPAYARAHILTRSDFPAAVMLPGSGEKSIKRYRPVDVRDWAEKWR